jgi:hypothetical protein
MLSTKSRSKGDQSSVQSNAVGGTPAKDYSVADTLTREAITDADIPLEEQPEVVAVPIELYASLYRRGVA